MVNKKSSSGAVVNQKEFVHRIQLSAKEAGVRLPATTVNLLVNLYHLEIASALENREKVKLMKFGNFEVRKRAARKGRNLRTGQEVKVPAKEVPVFTAGLSLKDAVNFSKPQFSSQVQR
jgi:DNA-binding protein HU-beta